MAVINRHEEVTVERLWEHLLWEESHGGHIIPSVRKRAFSDKNSLRSAVERYGRSIQGSLKKLWEGGTPKKDRSEGKNVS